MENYIATNYRRIERRHYLLLANQADYWFNASPNRMNEYRANYGEAFCLVLWRGGPSDDTYVLPYAKIKLLFNDQNLVGNQSGGTRWHGSIRDGYLTLRGASELLPVFECYNAFNFLQE